MVTTGEEILVLLLPIIAESIDSLNSLNLLMRTSKSLRVAASDPRLITSVVGNMHARSNTVIRKLFVLPANVILPFSMLPCPYRQHRLVPRCSVLESFRVAVVVHEGVRGMSQAFHRRQRRSIAMKLVWKKKRDEMERRWQARRRDIEQIHADLLMVPSSDHVTTTAELRYLSFGDVNGLSAVYRDNRKNLAKPLSKSSPITLYYVLTLHHKPGFMALYNAGLLYMQECSFLRVARVDLTAPDTLTRSQRLLVLRHNIAWEHYLVNFTNFITVVTLLQGAVTDMHHVESLFPLPSKWPWRALLSDIHVVGHTNANNLERMWVDWRERHDFLYDDMSSDGRVKATSVV
ncbi:hypothetical protein T484DRAFT_1756121 [Baffinella frigidus]|nr:hypothetical protein T484DRAFT_1756121 [Cryptophyta sp. CCMP2293]